MQASRTFQCLRHHQPFRTLLSLRNLESVCGSGVSHLYLHHHGNEVDNCLMRSLSTSSINQVDDTKLSALPLADRLSNASTDKSNDDFDISSLLQTDSIPMHRNSVVYRLVSEWHSEFIKAKQDGDLDKLTIDWWKAIAPKLRTAVDLSLKDSSLPNNRVKCLELLMHFDRESPLIQAILKQTLKSARYLSVKIIADVIHFLSESPSSESFKLIRQQLVLVLVNQRWFEISHQQIVFFLYQLDELFNMKEICLENRQSKPVRTTSSSKTDSSSPSIITSMQEESFESNKKAMLVNNINLENRLITLIDDMKPKDLARVITLMGKWRNRNQTLLLATVHRLSLSDMTEFTLIQLSNLLFACSILSIHSPALLNKIVSELSLRQFSSPASVSSILSSLSRLRWYDSNLVFNCMAYMSTCLDRVSAKDARSIVMSLSNLYAVPQSDDQMSVIKSLAHQAMSNCDSPSSLVDIVWCLAVINMLDVSSVSGVLQPEFIQQFTGDTSFQSVNTLQKLKGISMYTSLEMDGYEGPRMKPDLLDVAVVENASDSKVLSQLMLNALSKFVDMKSYVSPSQSLSGGIYADAVMCCDKEGNPKPLQNLVQDNTKDSHLRLILQVVPYNSVRTSDLSPCGSQQMTARHLNQLGYIPVQIPYSDLRKSQSVLEHVNAIQHHIKMAVQNRRISSTSSSSTPSSS